MLRAVPLTADRRKTIFALALPIIGGMLSQNLLNVVDTWMIGGLGDAALAAVGLGNFANFMASAFITGLSAGVQAVAARRLGEGRLDEMAVPLNAGLMLAIGLGVPLTITLFLLVPFLFPYLNDDPEVARLGIPYLQMRLLAMVALGSNFAFRGYWNAVNKSLNYFLTLILMHACNIAFNYVLIFGKLGFPELGVTGAGIGTTCATYVGTLAYAVWGLREAMAAGFLRRRPDRVTFASMLRISLPSALQQFLFAAGMTALFWIVGLVGTKQLAAANVLINLTLFAVLPALGFGLAATSLVSQALGRRAPDDAKAWAWDVAKLAVAVMTTIALPAMIAPRWLLSAFLHDPATLELAVTPLRLVALFIFTDGIGMVLMNSLLGAGDSRRVMFVAVGTQWLLFLPAAYIVGPMLGGGLTTIWALQIVYRVLQVVIFARMWQAGEWTKIKL